MDKNCQIKIPIKSSKLPEILCISLRFCSNFKYHFWPLNVSMAKLYMSKYIFGVCKTAEAELGGAVGEGDLDPPFQLYLYYLNPCELQISILSHLKNYPLDLLMLLY